MAVNHGPMPESAADQPPVEIPSLGAGIAIDVSDKRNPLVLVEFKNAGMVATLRIKAADAPNFFGNLAAAAMQASQQAIAAAGPQLITPRAGGLIVPGMQR